MTGIGVLLTLKHPTTRIIRTRWIIGKAVDPADLPSGMKNMFFTPEPPNPKNLSPTPSPSTYKATPAPALG